MSPGLVQRDSSTLADVCEKCSPFWAILAVFNGVFDSLWRISRQSEGAERSGVP